MSNQFNLEKIEVSKLPELQGWKEKQLAIVKENPFVTIVDNKTFEEAKKARTNLVSARTAIEKQEKTIASKIKDFRTKVGDVSNELILITLSHENKQQEEVKRYEAEKEAERVAKEKAEQIRKEAIENKIQEFYLTQKGEIDTLTFEKIELFKNDFQENLDKTDVEQFEEFELQFASKVQILKQQLNDKIQVLTDKEEIRLENIRLENIRLENTRKDQIKESISTYLKNWMQKVSVLTDSTFLEAKKLFEENTDADYEDFQDEFLSAKKMVIQAFSDKKDVIDFQKYRESQEANQKNIDEENAKKEAELNAKQKAIDDAEAKQKSEKEAAEKAERQAKEKAKFEAAEKQKAEEEAKRKEELKPTIEKLHQWVDRFEIANSPLTDANPIVSEIITQFENFKKSAKEKVSNII